MARTFAPIDLVTLPRLDANGAIYLARALESAVAKAKKDGAVLSEAVESATSDVRQDREALQQAIAAVATAAEIQKVDREEDASIGALHALLAAHARLAEYTADGDRAQKLVDRLFPNNDLSFINLKAREEWSVVESKLDTIARDHLAPEIEKLGGASILKHLHQVHKRYGVVTGATKPTETPEGSGVGDGLGALLESIRCFVVAVSGSVQRRKAKTRELADELLKPLAAWTSDAAAPKDASAGGVTPGGSSAGGPPQDGGGAGGAPPAPSGG